MGKGGCSCDTALWSPALLAHNPDCERMMNRGLILCGSPGGTSTQKARQGSIQMEHLGNSCLRSLHSGLDHTDTKDTGLQYGLGMASGCRSWLSFLVSEDPDPCSQNTEMWVEPRDPCMLRNACHRAISQLYRLQGAFSRCIFIAGWMSEGQAAAHFSFP